MRSNLGGRTASRSVIEKFGENTRPRGDWLTAAIWVIGRVLARAGSGRAAPGVRQRRVAALATFPVQARGDDDDLVSLGALLHLKEPPGDGLRLASHHLAVIAPGSAELLRAGEIANLLRPQRLTYPPADVLNGQCPRRFEVTYCLVIVTSEGQHRHR